MNIIGNPTTGNYNLVEFFNSTSTPISTFNVSLCSVQRISNSQETLVVVKPDDLFPAFTQFVPNSGYIVRAKNTFTIPENQSQPTYNSRTFNGSSNGLYTIFKNNYLSAVNISTFNSSLCSVQKASNSQETLVVVKPGDLFPSFTQFVPGSGYIIRTKETFTINNPVGTPTTALTGWNTSSMPSSQKWYSVTYGNGRFVAVAWGPTDVAAYSNDGGITWSSATMPSSQQWYSVTYGNGRFVAISIQSNVAAYSNDGITWVGTTMPSSQSWKSVTYGNGRFVAISYGATDVAAYSDDGITWVGTTMPSQQLWYSVTYGNTEFVVVAYGTNVAAYSSDGINWTSITMPLNQNWTSVTYGNGRFVAVAENGNAAYVNVATPTPIVSTPFKLRINTSLQ